MHADKIVLSKRGMEEEKEHTYAASSLFSLRSAVFSSSAVCNKIPISRQSSVSRHYKTSATHNTQMTQKTDQKRIESEKKREKMRTALEGGDACEELCEL